MEKNTFLAILLSVVVISIGFMIQTTFFMPEESLQVQSAGQKNKDKNSEKEIFPVETTQKEELKNKTSEVISEIDRKDYISKTIKVDTNKFVIIFDTNGGVISSLFLKEHQNEEKNVNMIYTGSRNSGAFGLGFGNNTEFYIKEPFSYSHKEGSKEFIFERKFRLKNQDGSLTRPFLLKKTYVFYPDEYMFELKIEIINSVSTILPLNDNGIAYTLFTAPQIGPEFKKLDGRNEYRRYYYLSGDKKSKVKLKNNRAERKEQVKWTAIAGKYFTLIGIPCSATSKIFWADGPRENLQNSSEMFYLRSAPQGSKVEDIYRFYMGPKNNRELGRYNLSNDNVFNYSDMYLDKVIDTSSWLGWLEAILKFILEIFHKIIPNFGIDIILMTILIKVIFFPITHKSYESTGKMQAIQPQIKELQEKYKKDPTKLNKEMANLYKKEGVNPMGGCLPLLIQMPIFFALYGLLNKYFDLRGAVFIPGWINDLSSPESVWNFGKFTIPILGWNDLRVLPIVYLGTQLIMTKFTQSPAGGGQSAMQTKMLTLGMPIMFFFILYDMPSGLLIYWIFSNILTAMQQAYISWKRKKEVRR